MIKEIKPNQSVVYHDAPFFKVKIIKAIKIDVVKKTIKLVDIENCISYIQKNNNFYAFDKLFFSEKSEYLIFGTDEDLVGNNSFRIKGKDRIYFGNAIFVKMSKYLNLDKLQSTKLTVEFVSKYIEFNK